MKEAFLSRLPYNEHTANISHDPFPISTIKLVQYPPDGTVSTCLLSFVSLNFLC
jgi:hypothetical protein